MGTLVGRVLQQLVPVWVPQWVPARVEYWVAEEQLQQYSIHHDSTTGCWWGGGWIKQKETTLIAPLFVGLHSKGCANDLYIFWKFESVSNFLKQQMPSNLVDKLQSNNLFNKTPGFSLCSWIGKLGDRAWLCYWVATQLTRLNTTWFFP